MSKAVQKKSRKTKKIEKSKKKMDGQALSWKSRWVAATEEILQSTPHIGVTVGNPEVMGKMMSRFFFFWFFLFSKKLSF